MQGMLGMADRDMYECKAVTASQYRRKNTEGTVDLKKRLDKGISDASPQTLTVFADRPPFAGNAVAALFCLASAFLVLYVCTKSSPLYPINDWVDANSFFTMGRGMLHGLVPYRDLFEQKGPLLYFLHALAALVSEADFLGVFMLEVASAAVFLFLAYRILLLYVDHLAAIPFIPVIAAIVYSHRALSHGDSAEEFCLPLIAFSLYHFLRYCRRDAVPDGTKGGGFGLAQGETDASDRRDAPHAHVPAFAFWNGLAAGCVLWIKYTMLGFWIGWMLFLFIDLLLRRQARRAFMEALRFLGGMAVASVPWLVYFAANGALDSLIDVYFVFNLTNYGQSYTLLERASRIFTTFRTSFQNAFFAAFFLGGVLFLFRSGAMLGKWRHKAGYAGMFLLLVLAVYGSGRTYSYYFLIFTPFLLPGIVACARYLGGTAKRPLRLDSAVLAGALALVACFGLVLMTGRHLEFRKTARSDLVQFVFAEHMKQRPDATLLNFGFLDGGFYLAAGVLPQERYFMKQNVRESDYPENMEAQKQVLRTNAVDYVVIRRGEKETGFFNAVTGFSEHYRLVMEMNQVFEGVNFNYQLYERLDD